MPRAFTHEEKEGIKQTLFTKGKEMLALFGVKKTSIDDLAKAAGISKGSFYAFYPSKEELFLEIMESAEAEARENFFSSLFAPGEPKKDNFKKQMQAMLAFISSNPLMANLKKDDMEYLLRSLPKEKVAGHAAKDEKAMAHYIAEWKRSSYIKRVDAEGLAAMFRAIFLLAVQKDDIGPGYEKMMDMLLEMMAHYLIDDK